MASPIDQLEHNQGVIREDREGVKDKVDQMLEAMLASSENNVGDAATDHVDSMSGFTVMSNPMYDSPLHVDDPIQPQLVLNVLSNAISTVQRQSTVQEDCIPHPQAAKKPRFDNYVKNPQGTNSMVNTRAPPDIEARRMCFDLKEQLRVLNGNDTIGLDAAHLCLVPDVVIPPKFKMPNFEKYKGVSCPETHLKMFVRKMSAYAHDEKFLIHCFQDSLSGASLDWYTQLEKKDVHNWKDLSSSFLKQYEFNLSIAPTRIQLQNLSLNINESFKEYAQRWRELAA